MQEKFNELINKNFNNKNINKFELEKFYSNEQDEQDNEQDEDDDTLSIEEMKKICDIS